jgi:hypothetical protein
MKSSKQVLKRFCVFYTGREDPYARKAFVDYISYLCRRKNEIALKRDLNDWVNDFNMLYDGSDTDNNCIAQYDIPELVRRVIETYKVKFNV